MAYKDNATSQGGILGQDTGMIINLNAQNHMSNTGADLVEFLKLNQPAQSATTHQFSINENLKTKQGGLYGAESSAQKA